jgi:hypothetical protein
LALKSTLEELSAMMVEADLCRNKLAIHSDGVMANRASSNFIGRSKAHEDAHSGEDLINELKQAVRLSKKALRVLGISARHTAADVRAIQEGNLFDADFYLSEYPVVSISGKAPLKHYLVQGWKDGFEPSPNVSMRTYMAEIPICARPT